MSDDIQTLPSMPADEPAARPAPDRVGVPVARRRSSGGIAWLIALIALAAAAFSLWRVYAIEHGQSAAVEHTPD